MTKYDYDEEQPDAETPEDGGGEETAAEAPEEEVNREELEQKTAAALSETFSDEDESDEPEAEDTDHSEGDEDESESDSDSESEEDEDSDDSDEETEDDAGEAAVEDADEEASSDAPTLPDAHRRSLYAYGWTDDEIDQNLQHLGDQFIRTAERIHSNRNSELQQFAQAGRAAREQEGGGQQSGQGQDGPHQKTTQTGNQPTGDTPSGLKPIDADALKKQYGEDELIDSIVGPVNATIEQLNQVLPQVQQGQQAVEQAELDRVTKQVDEFFGREDIAKPYSDLYGGNDDSLSDEQTKAREQVLDTAYDLMLGHQQLKGQSLPIGDALEQAHEIVAADHKTAAARKTVKKEAAQRSRGRVQRPSNKRGSREKKNGRPRSREELEQRTSQRLADAMS